MAICYAQKDGNASIYAHAVLEILFDFLLIFFGLYVGETRGGVGKSGVLEDKSGNISETR